MTMKTYIVETAAALLAVSDDGKLLDYEKFGGEKENTASKILSLEKGELIDELSKLIERLAQRNFKNLVVENEELARTISKEFPELNVEFVLPSIGGNAVREKISYYLEKIGFNYREYISYLHEISLVITRMKVREATEKRDLFVAQAISAIDETDKTINLYASRLREWYSLHFPELDELVKEHRDYVGIVFNIGLRQNMSVDKLVELGLNKGLAEDIVKSAKESMGADLTEFDLEIIRSFAENLINLYALRNKLEVYVDEAMKEVAPNIRGLVGPLLGARLIALAGGLQKLATLPASTIQVLGAEKALFRALKTGSRPPKHGVIFQYPAIFRAPRWQRGKIARALAAKLAIAARIDAFTGEYRADELKDELEKRIDEIKKLYSKPPQRVQVPRKGRKGRRRGRRRRR